MKRAVFLAGGAMAYAGVAAVLFRFAAQPLAADVQRGAAGDWTLLGLSLCVVLTVLAVWPAAALAMAALRAWRKRLTAAAP